MLYSPQLDFINRNAIDGFYDNIEQNILLFSDKLVTRVNGIVHTRISTIIHLGLFCKDHRCSGDRGCLSA